MLRFSWESRRRSPIKLMERLLRWQKEFVENGAVAFEQKRPTNHSADQERIAYLQKIHTKHEVLAALMAEHVALKKEIGEL
jgi:transposase